MRKADFLTKTVVYVLSFLTVFTIACFISNHINGLGQDTLIQWVFTVFGIELLATMVKKIVDTKYGKSNDNEEMIE
jgi:diacylglycerol kinase